MTLDGKMPHIACSLLHVYPFTPLPLMVYNHCMVCSLFTNTLFVVGKIAASSGHAAWVSGELSRARVFRMRAQSDAVIVGGNTVRRDSMLS
jgi:hypothetical protein